MSRGTIRVPHAQSYAVGFQRPTQKGTSGVAFLNLRRESLSTSNTARVCDRPTGAHFGGGNDLASAAVGWLATGCRWSFAAPAGGTAAGAAKCRTWSISFAAQSAASSSFAAAVIRSAVARIVAANVNSSCFSLLVIVSVSMWQASPPRAKCTKPASVSRLRFCRRPQKACRPRLGGDGRGPSHVAPPPTLGRQALPAAR